MGKPHPLAACRAMPRGNQHFEVFREPQDRQAFLAGRAEPRTTNGLSDSTLRADGQPG